ncbi:unnamed protein product [Cuscuta campestris]|uniref:Uncharacterized protein n=1 Tax=Cuscuta campestris TaxID=132261 RepID=A0A484KWT4_9ASTE|nr:unnamed protein product [Cuscuta campestris]
MDDKNEKNRAVFIGTKPRRPSPSVQIWRLSCPGEPDFATCHSWAAIKPKRPTPKRPTWPSVGQVGRLEALVVVIRELGITNLVRHSGAPTIHSAPPEKRLLLYILTRILRPRDGSHTCLFNEDLKAVHAITHGASINWAKYVMIHMADCTSITNERSLPYAFLIMDLIVASNIHIAGPDTKMTKLWIIQDSTFRKKSGDQGGAGPSRARAPAPAPARASLQSIADTLNRLTLTVDGMGQSIERMDWTLQRQHHDMMAYFRGVNYIPPPFDSTILGQNFEGEDEDDNSYAPSSSPDEADFEDAVDGDPMDVEDDEDDENEDDDAEDEDAAA